MASPNLLAKVETKVQRERHLLTIPIIRHSHLDRTLVKCEF